MAHRHGARVLVDGAQAVSHMRGRRAGARLRLLRLLRPQGVRARPASACVYGKRDVLEAMPPWQGGGNMIAGRHVRADASTSAAPARFEAGTGNIADAVGLGAALDYVDAPRHREHRALRARAARSTRRERLARVPGLRLIGTAPDKAGVLSFVLDGHTHRGRRRGARPGGHRRALRPPLRAADPAPLRPREPRCAPSLALYNTCEDIDQLGAAIRNIQSGRVERPG